MKNKDAHGIKFADFKKRIEAITPNGNQRTMLDSRINLLRGFFLKPGTEKPKSRLEEAQMNQQKKDQADVDKFLNEKADKTIWDFKVGELTIVDLSCPFIEEGAACTLFNICLSLFLEGGQECGRLVALDEAHKVSRQSNPRLTQSMIAGPNAC